jgi:nucleoid-associated protein EbfC
MNISDLMKMIGDPNAMKGRVEEMKARMSSITAVGSSGGGMVKITLNGQMDMVNIEIADEVVDPSDVPMLRDLVKAAYSDAMSKLRESLNTEVSGSFGGMLPPGFGL